MVFPLRAKDYKNIKFPCLVYLTFEDRKSQSFRKKVLRTKSPLWNYIIFPHINSSLFFFVFGVKWVGRVQRTTNLFFQLLHQSKKFWQPFIFKLDKIKRKCVMLEQQWLMMKLLNIEGKNHVVWVSKWVIKLHDSAIYFQISVTISLSDRFAWLFKLTRLFYNFIVYQSYFEPKSIASEISIENIPFAFCCFCCKISFFCEYLCIKTLSLL